MGWASRLLMGTLFLGSLFGGVRFFAANSPVPPVAPHESTQASAGDPASADDLALDLPSEPPIVPIDIAKQLDDLLNGTGQNAQASAPRRANDAKQATAPARANDTKQATAPARANVPNNYATQRDDLLNSIGLNPQWTAPVTRPVPAPQQFPTPLNPQLVDPFQQSLDQQIQDMQQQMMESQRQIAETARQNMQMAQQFQQRARQQMMQAQQHLVQRQPQVMQPHPLQIMPTTRRSAMPRKGF